MKFVSICWIVWTDWWNYLVCLTIRLKLGNLTFQMSYLFLYGQDLISASSKLQCKLCALKQLSSSYIMYCNQVRKIFCARFVTLHELGSCCDICFSLKGYFLTSGTFFYQNHCFLKTIKCWVEPSALQTNIATRRYGHIINRISSL